MTGVKLMTVIMRNLTGLFRGSGSFLRGVRGLGDVAEDVGLEAARLERGQHARGPVRARAGNPDDAAGRARVARLGRGSLGGEPAVPEVDDDAPVRVRQRRVGGR